MLIPDLTPDYEQHLCEESKSKETRSLYLWGVRRFATWSGPACVVADLTPIAVRRFLADYAQGHRPRSVRTLLAAVRHFARFCVEQGYLRDDPTIRVKCPRLDAPRREVPTPEKVADFLAAAERLPNRYRAAIGLAAASLMAFTGARIGEVLALELSDVQVAGRSIVIRKGKGEKRREMPICKEGMDAVRAYLRLRPKASTHPRLFSRIGGTPIGENMLRSILAEMATVAGYRGDKALLPHGLRHAYCTHSLDGGSDLEAVSLNMGHSSTAITLDMYRQVHQSQRDHVAEVIGAAYRPQAPPAEPPARRRIPARRS